MDVGVRVVQIPGSMVLIIGNRRRPVLDGEAAWTRLRALDQVHSGGMISPQKTRCAPPSSHKPCYVFTYCMHGMTALCALKPGIHTLSTINVEDGRAVLRIGMGFLAKGIPSHSIDAAHLA